MTTTGVVRHQQVEIAYRVRGEGPTILLITGLATPASAWGPFPAAIASLGYRVVTFDNRDCGQSSSGSSDYSMVDMADDALSVLDALSIEKAFVFGISMGGAIAQQLTLDHPERVERLMLVATGPGVGGGVPPEPGIFSAIFPTDVTDRRAALRTIVEALTAPGYARSHPDMIEMTVDRRDEEGSTIKQVTRQWSAILSFSSWERLSEIQVPTLVVHGDKDALVPHPNGVNLAARIPGAEFVTLKDVGHLVPLEAPAETLRLIQRFFEKGA